MRLLDKSNKLHVDKGSPSQMVDVPIDSPCCVVLTDSRIRNTGITSNKCKTKSGGDNHSKFYASHKRILLTGAILILLITLFLTIINLTFSILSGHDAREASVRIQPETRLERVIRLGFPLGRRSLLKSRAGKVIDGDPSFNDQTELTSQITQVAERDAFPTINGGDADTRSKREVVSRRRRDCDLKAKQCEMLLKTVQSYLEALSIKFPEKSLPTDIRKCLDCKELLNNADENDVDHAPQSKDQYFPHDYAEQNHSSDFGPAVIKLLDNGQAENGTKRTEINQTEAAEIQPPVETNSVTNNSSQNVMNQSSTSTSTPEITTMSIHQTDYNGSRRIDVSDIDINDSGINDKQSDSNPAANDSRVTKNQNDGSVSAAPKIDEPHRVVTESKDVTNAKSWFTTESSSMRTQYNAITGDEQSRKTTIATDSIGTTETRIPTYENTAIDLTTQITENVTSVPTGNDVIGIDGGGTMHSSVRPSFEGHPENRSATLTNGSKSMENQRDYEQFMSADQFQKDNGKSIPVTTESTKSFQQLQPTPTMWTMPHPVCFFGQYPGQSSNTPLSPVSAFYPGPISSAQSRGFPFLNPPNQGSSSPNYMQVQANTVQFMPRLNYVGNLAQPGQDVGPTGPAMSAMSNHAPAFSLNQQPTAMSQQPIANMPYFCGYISLPTIRFPPIPGTSQSNRSVDEAKDLPRESEKLPQKYGVITRNNPQSSTFNRCPINYHQCDNLNCVPKVKWCDGHVDCTDASDETKCSCRDRISRDRLCDGYFDCPHGEDELGCFGCSSDSFNCDDWDRRYNRDNCVPLLQRCDGVQQCSNGKDELDCNILLETHVGPNDIFTVGYTQGYLHKNVRGQWYPVCSKTLTWAVDACASEIGHPLTTMPKIQTVRVPENTFQDPYVIVTDNNNIKMMSCQGTAVFVKCPPLPCGTKALPRQNFSPVFNTTKNNYRRHAKEQSASEFNKLYRETLGLLNASQSMSEEKMQDQNDTIVGSQLRVVGGRASQPKAWPFLVAIYRDGNFHCGGVILTEVHILTAGHCMYGYEGHYYEIQAGILRRLSFSLTTQWRRAKHVIIHPGFVKEQMQNDIAIIVLDKPLLFNRWVRQVCLPALNTAGLAWREGPSPQSVCVAVGWGAIREDGPDPDHLREVEVPILSSCKYLSDQNNATICAGYPQGGRDACQGDSGGPLMCRNPNLASQWYAAGLISHGDGCGRPNEPGVYMKVSYYIDWILQTFVILDTQETSPYGDKPLDSCPGFSCQSSMMGKCLPKENHCDRIVHCLDGEDEIGCEILQINERYRESDSNNTSVKPQANETSSDATEKNKMSTETIPISTSSYFFYQTETQTYSDENSNITDTYTTTPKITMSSVRLTFTCKSLIQTIMINKKCDKHLDCEDGTDEEDCTCRDYLLNFQPTAICDGHLDCDDETDEKDCGICKDDEFYCSRSKGCIPMVKKCDGNFDCPLREDEVDCLALTNGEYVNMDSDNRPVLNIEGLLSRYYYDTWHVECPQPDILKNSTKMSIIGGNLCKYLGFMSLQSSGEIVVNKTVLETRFSRRWANGTTGYEPSPVAGSEGGETCTALRFRCRPVLSSSADSHLAVDPKTGSHTYLWPWLAAIFVDGRYHCSALLLESDWLLADSSCTEAVRLSVNYTTVLLGQSRSFLYVNGPHQQISVVDEIRDVKRTDVSLLHLKTAVNFTRYVQPLFLEKKIYPSEKDDLCVAIGTDNEHLTQSIFLQPILENCDKCYRCFVEALGIKCPTNGTSSNWSGTVFCRSEKGWYPAAVFHENDGPCSFQSTQNLTSIDYIHAYLTQALEKEPQPTVEATCDGVRCNIGRCVPWNQVCDGVADCRDGADEKNAMCLQVQQTRRKDESNRKCAKSELRCKNDECVSKSAFCDGKVDCSDGTDEPVRCSCAEYLKLTKPERLCDGVRHCLDKTDESPEACHCTETNFKCNTDSKNVTCISRDFVCDGDNDCPNGEDETECKKVQKTADNRFAAGEVVQRSYGVWHTLCYPSVVMSQEEAVNVCRKSGYTNGTINYEYQTLEPIIVPSRDDFYMIRLNSNTWITMRDDKPLINLVQPERPCYRLFVKCN
ncbi:serine protease ndl [Temnothorax longispinosus]